MMRAVLALVMLGAASASAAPVPKELKTAPSTVGTWRHEGQYWIIDAECGVIFGPTPTPAAGAQPTEIFKFDPQTNQVDHFTAGRPMRNYMGVYELNGDKLTICLNLGGQIRPKTVKDPGVRVWQLERVKEPK